MYKRIFREIEMQNRKNMYYGFTLVEVIIVVMILAIISLVSVPMLSNAESFQVKSAANMIASDLEYARSMAITTGQSHSVVFDISNESYEIQDSGGSVIAHPVKIGSNYAVDFTSDSRLDRVDIVSASTATFNYIGAPVSGGTISLTAGNSSMAISIEAVTGYISIQ